MNIKKYHDKQVEITKLFYVGNECLVNLRELATGKVFISVPIKELEKEHKTRSDWVSFSNKKLKVNAKFVKEGEDYKAFVAKYNLNPVFIDNCLKGISKTHKGFVIKAVEK